MSLPAQTARSPHIWGARLPPNGYQAAIRFGVGVIVFIAGVFCYQLEQGLFGYEGFGAPVESAMNFGLIADLCGAGIALWICALFALLARSSALEGPRYSQLAVAGAVLVGIAFIAFALAIPGWATVISGSRGRYDQLVGSLFFAGAAWSTGLVLATNALRRPDARSRRIAVVAVAVGLFLAIPAVAAAALYGAAVTD